MLGCYRLLKGVTKFYKGVERGLQGFTRVTGGCKGLHWDRVFRWGNRRLHRVTRGLQGVTRGYREI